MPSRAHEVFWQIIEADDPAQVLKSMVISHRTETEFLEFKGAGKIQARQVKEFWSQALSGFANTEGGVLIWGVRAARIEHPDDSTRKIDVAADLDLVQQPATFVQLLKDVLLEACIEPVQGVELREFESGQGNGSGFVICLVPEGNHKPYRAGLDPARQYYQRVGDNFVVIPHSLLRSLFFPQLKAHLQIRMKATVSQGTPPRVKFSAYVSNRGQATARELFVVVETNKKMDFKSSDKFRLSNRREGFVATYEAFQSVHPGAELLLFSCTGSLEADSIEFRMNLHSQHQAQQDAVVYFSPDDVLQEVEKTAAAELC